MTASLSESTTPLLSNQYKKLGHPSGQSQYTSILMCIPHSTPDYNSSLQDAIKKYPAGKTLITLEVMKLRYSFILLAFTCSQLKVM